MAIKEVIDELDGPEFQKAIADKFDVDLDGRPKMYWLRGYTRSKDGQIHTDSKDKIITVLLYLNENLAAAGRAPAHPARRRERRQLTPPRLLPTKARCSCSSARTAPGMATIRSKVRAARCR